jgi:hypothetical protein
MHQPHIRAGGRYPILRTIAILWLVGALLALIGGIYQAVCALAGWHDQELMRISGDAVSGRIISCSIWLASTFFAVLLSVAVAELIKLFIDIEENSRALMSNGHAVGSSIAAPVDGPRGKIFVEETAEGALLRGH